MFTGLETKQTWLSDGIVRIDMWEKVILSHGLCTEYSECIYHHESLWPLYLKLLCYRQYHGYSVLLKKRCLPDILNHTLCLAFRKNMVKILSFAKPKYISTWLSFPFFFFLIFSFFFLKVSLSLSTEGNMSDTLGLICTIWWYMMLFHPLHADIQCMECKYVFADIIWETRFNASFIRDTCNETGTCCRKPDRYYSLHSTKTIAYWTYAATLSADAQESPITNVNVDWRRKMELSWESSRNFSEYICTITDGDEEYVEIEVNLQFIGINNGTFYQFHWLWKKWMSQITSDMWLFAVHSSIS